MYYNKDRLEDHWEVVVAVEVVVVVEVVDKDHPQEDPPWDNQQQPHQDQSMLQEMSKI